MYLYIHVLKMNVIMLDVLKFIFNA